MFDLEQQIRNWRTSMAAHLPHGQESIAELESHLRDSVQKHCQAGLSPQDAWTMAINQLGDPNAIAAEFKKVNVVAVWKWLPARIVLGGYAILALLVGWGCLQAYFVRRDPLLAIHAWSVALGYLGVVAIGLLSAWSVTFRAFQGWSTVETGVYRRATRSMTILALALVVCGILFGGLWLRKETGQFWNFNPRELGGLAVVAWNVFVLRILVRITDERTTMRLGLTGSAIIAACWILPVLISRLAVLGYAQSASLIAGLAGVMLIIGMFLGLTLLRPGQLRLARD